MADFLFNPFTRRLDIVYTPGGASGGTTGYSDVVTNYAALPDPTLVAGQFYFVENPQGTSWLWGSLGGTYYPAGTYYSNGIGWTYEKSAYQASQATVDAGFITDQFVAPYTLHNSMNFKLKNMEISTGLYRWDAGIVRQSASTFSVGYAKGYIVDSSTPESVISTLVEYAGGSGLTTPYLGSDPATFVLIDNTGTLILQNTEPTMAQRRTNIYLGVIGHPTGSITGTGDSPDIALNTFSQTKEMFNPIKFINADVSLYANSTDLTLANTAGILFGLGIGFIVNGNNGSSHIDIPAGAPTTFQYRTQIGTTSPNTTVIEPLYWDNAGVDTLIGGSSNQATNQRFYLLQNGNIRAQKGQTVYSTLAAAITAAKDEAFVIFENNRLLGVLIGVLSVQKGCTDLSDTSTCRFLAVSKFGDTYGTGGTSVSTMQNTYNNSGVVDPQILTNSVNDGVKIRRGSLLDTDNVFVIQNGAGLATFSIDGNGLTKVNSLQVWDSVSATFKVALASPATGTLGLGAGFSAIRIQGPSNVFHSQTTTYSTTSASMSLQFMASGGNITINSSQHIFGYNNPVTSSFTGNLALVQLGNSTGFAPTSGATNLRLLSMVMTYAQSGTATGSMTGIYYAPVLTGVLGSHYFIDALSGNNNFSAGVDSTHQLGRAAIYSATATNLYIAHTNNVNSTTAYALFSNGTTTRVNAGSGNTVQLTIAGTSIVDVTTNGVTITTGGLIPLTVIGAQIAGTVRTTFQNSSAFSVSNGVSLLLQTKNDASNYVNAGQILVSLTNVTAGAEISKLELYTLNGGAAGARFYITGNVVSVNGTMVIVGSGNAFQIHDSAGTARQVFVSSSAAALTFGGGYSTINVTSGIFQFSSVYTNAVLTSAKNFINAIPTVNQTGTATEDVTFLRYTPTLTAVLGVHYFIVAASGIVTLGETQDSTSSSTGALRIAGGGRITGKWNVGATAMPSYSGQLNVYAATGGLSASFQADAPAGNSGIWIWNTGTGGVTNTSQISHLLKNDAGGSFAAVVQSANFTVVTAGALQSQYSIETYNANTRASRFFINGDALTLATPSISLTGGSTTFTNTSGAITIQATTGSNGITLQTTGTSNTNGVNIGAANTITLTSGTRPMLRIAGTFAPTSGTGALNGLSFETTYNQTGTSSGVITGINYNPTLTGVLGTHYFINATSGLVNLGGALTVASDTDITTILGRVRIDSRTSDFAFFSHFDITSASGYALRQGTAGHTTVNAVSGQTVRIAINNNNVATFGAASNDMLVPTTFPSYTVAGVPSAVGLRGAIIYITNESGGEVHAFSDNVNWRRVTDRAIIS